MPSSHPPARLPSPLRDEVTTVAQRLRLLDGALDWPAAATAARP